MNRIQNREQLIDLCYDLLMNLGQIECDCDRVVDPSRSISREDVGKWLDACRAKEVQQIAELYIKAGSLLRSREENYENYL